LQVIEKVIIFPRLSCPPFVVLRINSGGHPTLLVIPAQAGIQFFFVVMVSLSNHRFPLSRE
jgi:hypothetical protein